MKYHKRASVWLVILLCLCTYLFGLFQKNKFNVESDLLKLIPHWGYDENESQALNAFSEKLSRQMVFLIAHEDQALAQLAVDVFAGSLEESGHFHSLRAKVDVRKESRQVYHYYSVACLIQLAKYINTDGHLDLARLGKVNLRKLYSPQSSFYSSSLKSDPFLLFSKQLEELQKLAKGKIKQDKDGYLYLINDGVKLFVIAGLAGYSSFSSTGQLQLRHAISTAQQKVLQEVGESVSFQELGALPFAEVAQATGKNDAQMISLFSILFLIVLIWRYFRNFAYFLAILSSLLAGLLAAVSVSLLVYGELHLFVLAFGASLIGVTVDYSFHYFAFYQEESDWSHRQASGKIGRALIMGFTTSVLAYGALLIPAFPGIRGIALFSLVGLAASFATVYLLYPWIFSRIKKKPHKGGAVPIPALALPKKFFLKRYRIFTLLLVISLIGVWSFSKKNNDVRSFSFVPQSLTTQDKKLRTLVSDLESSAFLIVRAASESEVLQKTSQLHNILNKEFPEVLFRSPADVIINEGYWRTVYETVQGTSPVELKTYEERMSLKPGTLQAYLSQLEKTADVLKLNSQGLRELNLFHEYLSMLTEVNGEHFSIVLFEQGADFEEIKKCVAGVAGVNFIHRAESTSRVMDKFHIQALWMTLFAYVLIFLAMIKWRGWRNAGLILLVPLTALSCSWGILSICGFETNLFSVFAAILLLGIGIDYSIFYNCSEGEASHVDRAVFFSAITSMIAFGLLAFSSFPALKAFGLVMFIGIFFVYFLAPLAKRELTLKEGL